MLGSSFINPTKPVIVYNSIEDILKTIDPNILPKYLEPQFGEGANASGNYIEVLTQKAVEIRNYIASKYSEDLSNLSDIDVIALGIVLVPFEQRDMFLGRVSNQQAFDCMMTAIGVATGLSSLYSLWTSGATTASIIGTLKNVLKFAGGWFSVGYGVWKFGECVGWW